LPQRDGYLGWRDILNARLHFGGERTLTTLAVIAQAVPIGAPCSARMVMGSLALAAAPGEGHNQ
jgi:hypothetical protein